MSLLDTPAAKALLDEATVSEDDVASCEGRLATFLERYLPLFYRKEQRENACVVIRGLLSDLERKTAEPIACREGRERKPIQFFVGRGLWDDEKVMAESGRPMLMYVPMLISGLDTDNIPDTTSPPPRPLGVGVQGPGLRSRSG